MLTQVTNIHHSKLPPIGAIGRIRGLASFNQHEKYIVEAYPLNDNVSPYSIGIHTCFVRSLKFFTREPQKVSGIWFKVDEEGK